jgi:hypothetical protein
MLKITKGALLPQVAIAIATLMILSSVSLQAAVLYSQPGSTLPGQRSADLSSGRAVFDDFTLAADAQMTRVEWTGGIVSAANPSGVATAPAVSFFLSLRADDGLGAPDPNALAVLTNFTVVPGLALSSSNSQAVFNYGLDLQSAVNLSANTRYWLQITALFTGPSTDNTLHWDWSFGSGGNGLSYAFQPGPGANANGYASFQSDMSFSIIGTSGATVPESSGLVLLALGFAAAAGVCRYRF